MVCSSNGCVAGPRNRRFWNFIASLTLSRVTFSKVRAARAGEGRNFLALGTAHESSRTVVQLAIHALGDFDFHFELGARLATLRDRGVLIVGSGNIVHNLRALKWSEPELAFDWTRRFDDAARAVLTATFSRPAGPIGHATECGALRARSAPEPTPIHL